MSADESVGLVPGAMEGPQPPAAGSAKCSSWLWLLANFEELATAVLLAVMIGSVCLGVFYRYVLSQPLAWTEEIVLLCMVWVVFLGASIATKSREHIVIDILLVVVPRGLRRGMEMVSLVVVTGVLIVLAWQGFILLDKTRFMTTTALLLPTGLMYAAVPVSAVLMAIHNLRHLYRDLRGGGEVSDDVR